MRLIPRRAPVAAVIGSGHVGGQDGAPEPLRGQRFCRTAGPGPRLWSCAPRSGEGRKAAQTRRRAWGSRSGDQPASHAERAADKPHGRAQRRARPTPMRQAPSSEPLLTSSPPWQAVRIFPHSRPVLVRTYKAHSPHFNHCLEKISLWHLFHVLLYCKDYSVLPHDYI